MGASLAYGFQAAFTEPERVQLALLHLFQGVVSVDAFCWMGDPEVAGAVAVPALGGLSPAVGIGLLDRAVEVGLLTGAGVGYYRIHPALPWYFQDLFAGHHGPPGSAAAHAARHAYTCAIATLGDYWHNQYAEGRGEVVGVLAAEEANLLHAWELARTGGWWDQVLGAMQGLRTLYAHTGQRVAWARLVSQVTPELVDPATGQPRPGREDHWSLLTEYRVGLARQARDWPTATRLQQARVAWERERAAGALAADPAILDDRQRNQLRTLGVSLHELGQVLRDQGEAGCVAAFTESLELDRRLGDRHGEAITAYNLGGAYDEVAALRDLDQAQRWYQHSLDLHAQADRRGQSVCINALGGVQFERFREALAAGRPDDELLGYLNAALASFQQALALTPSDAPDDLAVSHGSLGNVYAVAGQVDAAMGHYREAVRYREAAGDRYGAGQTRSNVALLLQDHGRLGEGSRLPWTTLGRSGPAQPTTSPRPSSCSPNSNRPKGRRDLADRHHSSPVAAHSQAPLVEGDDPHLTATSRRPGLALRSGARRRRCSAPWCRSAPAGGRQARPTGRPPA